MNAQTPTSVDTNMVRCFMNTTIQWFADMGINRMHFICDATMFDVGILAPQVNPLGQIVLNLSGKATMGFKYSEEHFSFHCGSQGQDVYLEVPYEAVLGFNVPFGDNNMVSFPIPNLERHMLEVSLAEAQREHLKTYLAKHPNQDFDGDRLGEGGEELPDGAYAVHSVNMEELTKDMPTIKELMDRKPLAQRPKPAPVKEAPKPLLDFGHLPGDSVPAVQPKPRRVGAPHLTVIQGGKA
uniref:Stringent starvation protein B n=1 Tax=Pseudomonas phage RVTF4 TaxID=3236931 RepID=A0AB39CD50_9VIRU